MKKKKLQCSVPTLLLAGVLCLTLAACGAKQSSDMPASDTESAASAALPVKAMNAKRVDENPYMAKSDANIHHDGYNTDSTDEVLPLGIYPEINVSYEKTNANASPAIYFDSYGHAVVPLLGGIAIRNLNAEETTTLGYFSPKQHDGGGYVIQSSYTFLDSENRIVCPTSNNHVLMLRATDEAGNVLPEFEKVLDIDIKAAAEAALGKELTQNLLSVVFDYDGNLWFATGGFRIYPEREQQGVLGYIAHSAIEAILNGEQADLSKAVFVYGLALGEGAENGIAASKDGAVILTNQNCYLLRANNGVEAVWCTPYESVGAKVSGENDKTTGGGLAWGGGCSPSLTPDLVMFTDNADPVKLLALDMKTGEIVASMPVLDDLPEGYQVAVENSAIVYDDSEGTVSTIVCNWFGAGSAGLADPNSDSSIQSYANIYDMNWLTKGNCMIAPGVERVDTVKTDSGYASKYALSERLVCGECGTLYRRCTWTRNGEKRVVWRCVSRLDYGKKYCHNSPTLDEAPLQQAILAALNTAMADKNSLIRQITDAMETEIIPFPGGTMSLGDIERRLRELEQQFQTLLEKATDDPAAYGGQFKEILDGQTFLKEKRAGILADNSEQAKANQRILDAAQTLENASPHITEWDESAVRQLVETVKVLSKDEIAVTMKGGIEIRQKIMY